MDNRDNKKVTVLVAGGAGFVGSAITRHLALHGHKVVVLDNCHRGSVSNLSDVIDVIRFVEGDALDPSALDSVFRDHHIEYAISCIGDTFVPAAYELPERFFQINVNANLSILKACKHWGITNTVYISSTEVYGDVKTQRIDENAPLDPVNTYAVTKLAADRLCATFAIEHSVPVTIARIFNCYGPRETHPYLIPEIISQLERSPLVNLGNLTASRDFTYVGDTAAALIDLLFAKLPGGEVVNVGSGTAISVLDLVTMISRLMGVDSPEIRVDPRRLRRRDIDRFCCDNAKLIRLTGWSPRVGMEEGLRRTIDWFQEAGSWPYEDAYDTLSEYPTALPAPGGSVGSLNRR